jgi:hypothetical protein
MIFCGWVVPGTWYRGWSLSAPGTPGVAVRADGGDRLGRQGPGRAPGPAPGGRGSVSGALFPGLAGEVWGDGLGVARRGGWELVLEGSEGGVRGVATWSAP